MSLGAGRGYQGEPEDGKRDLGFLLRAGSKLETRTGSVKSDLMSTEPSNIFERRFHNQLDDLSHVTVEAVRWMEQSGVDDRAIYVGNLAIEEMATNILKYGYDDAAVHEILLRLEIDPVTLVLVLEDDGHEFNPLGAPEPEVNLAAEERMPGGLGIHLVRKLAEQMNYERCDGRNRLTVTIRC